MQQKRPLRLLILIVPWVMSSVPVAAMDHVLLKRDGKQIAVEGRCLVTSQDGGLLILARDGVLWTIQPDEQLKHTTDQAPFQPFSRRQLCERLLATLPAGFEVHETEHYLIFHDTTQAYAKWCGSLFEKLYRAFTNLWTRKKFDLSEPEFPLVAIVFADRQSYVSYSQEEVGEAIKLIPGYFSLRTNRMTMYDLTGSEASARSRDRRGSLVRINRMLEGDNARRTVATIVHEATHQIAFNCGLHARYSDCPMWFSEGIALYFETPDLGSSKGWRTVGAVNQPRLSQFRQYLNGRPDDALATLVRDDERFRDTKKSPDAYAEAWALTYFLLRKRSEQYVTYLKMLSEKTPLLYDDQEARLKQFRRVFGDLRALDAEFLRYMLERVR